MGRRAAILAGHTRATFFPPVLRHAMPPLKKFCLIAAIVLALTVLVLETVPRWVELPGLGLRDLNPVAAGLEEARVEPHPYLAYVPKPGFTSKEGAEHQIAHNSLGFRGPEVVTPKPAGTFRILCLGGSSTYGHGPTSNDTTWPARLQAYLSQAKPDALIEVVNGGCQGYSSFESLANLAFRGLPLQPDLVVVYHTINDMRCALYPGVRPDNTHWRANWMRHEPSVLESSYTFLILRAKLTDYIASQSDLGAYVIRDFEKLLVKGDPYAWRSETGFRNFHRNLNSIVSLARENGAAVLLTSQGLKRETLDKAPSREDQLRAFEYMRETIKIVADSRGTAFCDAATVMESEAARRNAAGESPIFTNDVHMTDDGADLLAKTIAIAIFEQELLSPE